MTKIVSPSLLITDYYDELIQRINIYTEQLIQKYDPDDLLPPLKKPDLTETILEETDVETKVNEDEGFYNQRFESAWQHVTKYNYDEVERIPVEPGATKIHDYVRMVEAKALSEIERAQRRNLTVCRRVENACKLDDSNEMNVEDLERRLFNDKYCFLLDIDEFDGHQNQCLHRLYTVVTDFYLSPNDLDLLKKFIQESLLFSPFSNNCRRLARLSTIDLNEKNLLLYLTSVYIDGLWTQQTYGFEVTKIEKDSIANVENVVYNYLRVQTVDLDVQSCILDLSAIKTLFLSLNKPSEDACGNLIDLSALQNLEILTVEKMKLAKSSLNGLRDLTLLDLRFCDLSEFDYTCFKQFYNLRYLQIKELSSPIDFKDLSKLEELSLPHANITCIKSLNYNLASLYLNSSNITRKDAQKFFDRFDLYNLETLVLVDNKLLNMDKAWFSRCKNLKTLDLQSNYVENLEFLQCRYLEKLEYLDVSENNIKMLRGGLFSKLTNLKTLKLDSNPIYHIESNFFKHLKTLKYFSLNKLRDDVKQLKTNKVKSIWYKSIFGRF